MSLFYQFNHKTHQFIHLAYRQLHNPGAQAGLIAIIHLILPRIDTCEYSISINTFMDKMHI